MHSFKTLILFATSITLSLTSPLINEERDSNSDWNIEESLRNFFQKQEFAIDVPSFGSTITMGARNLLNDELNLKVQFGADVEARKSKLKKIFAPIVILLILKAITLIPLAIGILGIKTWNALQLSFATFVISVSLAVFQICKKLAADHAHPVIAAHGWNKRSLENNDHAHSLAYSAYAQ